MIASSPIVSLRGITKQFPGVCACDQIDLDVFPGQIHALLGENGAGKTTLMKILSGMYQPDAGEIWIDGTPVAMPSPKEAMHAGISMVFQHFTLIPSLTVAENIALGVPGSRLFWRHQSLTAHVQRFAAQCRLHLEPDRQVWQLSVGEQQRVEILKLLYRRARILILDEPTAMLAPQEVDALLGTLRNLAAAGHSVLLITHKLSEALAVAHRITVLRRGHVVANTAPAEVSSADLARAMIGRDLQTRPRHQAAATDSIELVLTGVNVKDDQGRLALKQISLEVRRGEIMGIAGVAGNGQRELAEVVVGLRRASAGTVSIHGEDMTSATPEAIVSCGVSYIPEDRQGMGLVPSASILDNLLLKAYRRPPVARGPLLNYHAAAIVALSTFGPAVSDAIKSLVEQRQQDLSAGRFDVFWGAISDQAGKVRIGAGEKPADEVLLGMDWFVEGVVGTLPK